MSRAEAKRPTKPSRKPAKRPAKPRGKVGGARPNSGPDPVLGPGNVRSVIKTVRLSPVEDARQQTVARRAGAKDWGTWIRDLGNAEAARSDREVFADQLTREETSGAAGQLAGAVIDDTRLVSIAAGDAWPDDLGAPGGPGTSEAREMAAEIIKLREALSEIAAATEASESDRVGDGEFYGLEWLDMIKNVLARLKGDPPPPKSL